MIEYTTLDYEGEPVIIEDGEILEVETPKEVWNDHRERYMTEDEGDIFWDSDELDWTIDLYDFCGNDARDYGLGWYDCNSDWRSW